MLACVRICLAESTVLKRPSNGAPEMKADRVERACLSACQDLLAFAALLARHDVTRARRRERGAGVSRSECEQCGLVHRWGVD